MFGRLFPVLCLLSTCTVLGASSPSASSPSASSLPVLALVGGDATLPCLLAPSVSGGVEWSKPDLQHKDIYVYRNGYEIRAMQNPAYKGRTRLLMDRPERGIFSLLLSDVRLSDAGTYRCLILPLKMGLNVSVELQVGAVSQPEITIEADSSGVFLQCEATCWFPRPEIQWLDGDGSDITAKTTWTKDDDSGCFTVTGRVPVPESATNRFTCRVHQQEINQTREAKIQLQIDCMKSCTKEIVITVVSTFFLTLGLSGVVHFGWRKWRHAKDAKKQKPPPPLLPVINEASDNRDNIIKELESQVAKLKKQLCDKDEQIKKLQSKEQLHVDQPTIPCVPTDATGTTDSKSLPRRSRPCNLPRDHGPKAGNLTTHDNDPKPSTSAHSDHPNSSSLPKAKPPKPGTSKQNKNPTATADSNNPHHSTTDLSEGSKPNHKRTKSMSRTERPLSTSPLRHFRVPSFSSSSVLSNNRFSALAESDPDSES